LFLSCPLACALDAEVDKPYQLKVVLDVARHPMLTDVFKDRLQRELRDSLAAALGDMGQVQVVTDHPLLKQIQAKGLDAGLDGAGKLGEGKTHIVSVDFVEGRYRLRTRQIDGMTGLVSPMRREETGDRLYVARAAALLIARDFGMIGTLPGQDQANEVPITIKAAKLGGADRWVKKGDVFAAVQISTVRGETRAELVPWAVLQALDVPDASGVCRCRLYQRYKQSLNGGPGVLGYRCIKLGTIEAPLHLRFVDEKTRRPLGDQAVTVARTSFEAKPDEEHASDADGLVTTRALYSNLAFVRVVSGATVRARIPVPVVDTRPVLIPISVQVESEARGQFELRRRHTLGQLYESLLVVDDLFKRLNKLVEAKDHAAALKAAETGLTELQADITARTSDLTNLRALAADFTEKRPDLAEGEQRLQELKNRGDELTRFVDNLKLIKNAAEKRAELLGMVERARLLEGEAEFGKAIAVYKEIAAKADGEPMVREHAERRVADLEKLWTTRKDVNMQKFIFETWPKQQTAAQVKEHIAEASKAFEACRDAQDRLSPRMLLKTNLAHVTRLKKRLDSLQPKDREDDRREAEDIAAAAEQLKKLTEDISTYLRTDAEKK
jgi:hypothetical protein